MIREGVDGQGRCLLILSDTLVQFKQQSLTQNGALHVRAKKEKKYKMGTSTLNEQNT